MTEPKKPSRARRDRGMKTQELIAARWRTMALFPYAQSTGSGRPGRDILLTPGMFVEVKARGDVSLPSQLKKAQTHATAARLQSDTPGEPADMPVIIWRHNGQGEASMGEWSATVYLADLEDLLLMREDYRLLRLSMKENGL